MKDVVIIPGFDAMGFGIEAYFLELEKELKREEYNVYIVNNFTEKDSLEKVLRGLNDFVKERNLTSASFVGYSLGGHILMHYIDSKPKIKIDKAIFALALLGTSKVGKLALASGMIKAKEKSVLYEAIHHDISDHDIPKNIKIGIIQGNKKTNKMFPGSYLIQPLFLLKANDGLLTVDETILNKPKTAKNCHHAFVKTDHFTSTGNVHVIEHIKKFLNEGKF